MSSLPETLNGQWLVTIIVCAIYLVLLGWTRKYIIWAEDRGLLFAHIDKLGAELDGFPEHLQRNPGVESVRTLLRDIRGRVEEVSTWRSLFSSGSEELQAWYSVHDAKLLLVQHLPWPQIKARMETAIVELRTREGSRQAEGVVLATRLESFLQAYKNHVPVDEMFAEARAELHRALRIIYSMEGEDDQKATLWHNKILWLSCCSLLFIVVLTGAVGMPQLFLLGALGAFVSKLVRLRTRSQVPTNDYDYNWTSLFVIVPLGALMGWSGVLIAMLLREGNLLGSAFEFTGIKAHHDPDMVAYAVAFLCGFSERFFDQVIEKGSAKVLNTGKQDNASQNASQSSKPTGAGATGACIRTPVLAGMEVMMVVLRGTA